MATAPVKISMNDSIHVILGGAHVGKGKVSNLSGGKVTVKFAGKTAEQEFLISGSTKKVSTNPQGELTLTLP